VSRPSILVCSFALLALACTREKASSETVAPDKGGAVTVVAHAQALPRTPEYVELAAVPNAGTLKGTITYAGSKQPAKLNVTKDTKICTHGGEPDGSLQVAGGKLKNAVVAVTDPIAQGKRWSSSTVLVDNKECLFEPRVQIARQPGQVETKNSDPVLHNANLVWVEAGSRQEFANIPLPLQGRSQTKDFKKSGFVEFKCDVHDWMKAWIYVTPHPYAAVTGADGRYAIEGIPPGEHTATIWHEELGQAELKVTVDPDGSVTLDHVFN
jgi:plastocyanin